MALLDILKSLGFANCELISEKKGVATVKVRTSRGWAYDRFATADEVRAWANGKVPG